MPIDRLTIFKFWQPCNFVCICPGIFGPIFVKGKRGQSNDSLTNAKK